MLKKKHRAQRSDCHSDSTAGRCTGRNGGSNTDSSSLPLLPLNVLALAAGFVAACQHAVCADVHKEPKSC